MPQTAIIKHPVLFALPENNRKKEQTSNLNPTIKSIQDIMRKDAGVDPLPQNI
jgi:hypothetical protein